MKKILLILLFLSITFVYARKIKCPHCNEIIETCDISESIENLDDYKQVSIDVLDAIYSSCEYEDRKFFVKCMPQKFYKKEIRIVFGDSYTYVKIDDMDLYERLINYKDKYMNMYGIIEIDLKDCKYKLKVIDFQLIYE